MSKIKDYPTGYPMPVERDGVRIGEDRPQWGQSRCHDEWIDSVTGRPTDCPDFGQHRPQLPKGPRARE